MTREEVYTACLNGLSRSNFLLLELPTGYGKTKQSIDLVNHLSTTHFQGKQTSLLLLVAKTVHKQTWKDEIRKWGGIKADNITIECYESLRKHESESFDFIIADEVHHLGSDARLDLLSTIKFKYFIGLSATIPWKTKQYFRFNYHSWVVSCKVGEAIEDEVLPEPTILLLPLQLDNKENTETFELNPKAKGPVKYDTYVNKWKYKKSKEHVILSCTQRQKMNEMNSLILWEKNRVIRTRSKSMEFKWLHHCGERLEWLAGLKNNLVKRILYKLAKQRTITFCKTIEQAEYLGKFCIHSKNKHSEEIYNSFNEKKINHITAVNILNENANLVDCKYAIFANYSSSVVASMQRCGRALRHKSPVIILPYYEGTREEEIINDVMLKDFNKNFVRTIHSIDEI